jgi:hypothetical protein
MVLRGRFGIPWFAWFHELGERIKSGFILRILVFRWWETKFMVSNGRTTTTTRQCLRWCMVFRAKLSMPKNYRLITFGRGGEWNSTHHCRMI